MSLENEEFDVAVIGGGPAGMMAAGRAAQTGANVILIEKNRKLGKKLLLTGNGRCNITSARFDIKELVKAYGKNGKFLFYAFSLFGPQEVVKFFEKRGLKTKIERGERVFPKNDRATSVLKTLTGYLKKEGVTVLLDAQVRRLSHRDGKIKKAILKEGGEVRAKSFVIATGGISHSLTGSSGDGIRWASKLSHRVEEMSPALVPVETQEDFVKSLQGLDLKNVKISIKENERKKEEIMGECVFTHFGVGGPAILKLSKKIGEIKKKGKEVKISIDLKPGLDEKKLDERVQRDFEKHANKQFKNSLFELLPTRLISVIVDLSGIDPQKKVNKVTKKERKDLVRLLKNFELTVKRLMGFDMAIVTAGGVSLGDIDQRSMQSKKVENLFFAGELIDVDGTTGGFNLQACWSTGYLAGESAAKIWKD